MNKSPRFTSLQDYISRLSDVDFWRPYVNEILKRHNFYNDSQDLIAGFNPTYPTFFYGDSVVKLFGYSNSWQ